MLTLVAFLGRTCAVAWIVAWGLFAGGEAVACILINDFVKDVENGKSERILNSRFTLVDTRKDGLVTVRRYSHTLPSLEPSEIMQIEIVDDDDAWSRAWEQSLAARKLRVRPHSVSHWIDVMPGAVLIDIADTDQGCPREGCHRFRIIFSGKEGDSLMVGFYSRWLGGGKWQLEEVNLSVVGYYRPTCVNGADGRR
jgi:hypothetical protein